MPLTDVRGSVDSANYRTATVRKRPIPRVARPGCPDPIDTNNTIVVCKYSKLLGFLLRLYPLRYVQVRLGKHKENGGKTTCNVYFPRSQVDGLE